MSYQAYIDNITAKTGKSPSDMHQEALSQNIIEENMKASVFTDWVKAEYGLGHGHAMALWKYFVDHQWLVTQNTKLKK